MRPVLLQMHGFAGFREAASVDFTGVEYFALVGPTGSGKSTVIDAMTFALYGSVPRWDDRRTVSLALSPTANRGTVRLLFDVGPVRYVVARELRRAASGSVTVRNARLERLADAKALGGPDDETEVVASDSLPVSKAVEELLGLPFEQFCICVVLPQGDFAQFLHAKPADRQRTLTRILGLGMYETMARDAATEAKMQTQRAELLTEQLGGYADATGEALGTAAERVAALSALVDRVAEALPGLAERESEVVEAQRRAGQLRAERDELAGLRAPDGLDELATGAREAETASAAARQALAAAEVADTEARGRMAAAPDREPLRRLRRDHAELAALRVGLPGLQTGWEQARRRTEDATTSAAGSAAGLEAARAERDRLAAALQTLRAEVDRLVDERGRLSRLRAPDGVAELDERRRAAAAALTGARRELADAEEAEAGARAALAGAPDRYRLTQARKEHAALLDAVAERAAGAERHRGAAADGRAAEQALADAERELAEAVAARAAAQRTDLVGALRPGLAVHQPCPVCEQRVEHLPAPSAAADLAASDRAVEQATGRRDRAGRAQRSAADAERRAAAELDGVTGRIAALRAALADAPPDLAEVDRQLAEAERLAEAARVAEERSATARAARAAAEAADAGVARLLATSAAELRAARDPLVALGAPTLDSSGGGSGEDTGELPDLAASWRRLTGWAGEAEATRAQEHHRAGTELRTAEQAHAGAERDLAGATEQARRLREQETASVRAEQDAHSELTRSSRRAEELTGALDGQPSDDELADRLAELDELAATVRAADAALRAARAALTDAAGAEAQAAGRVERGWQALRSARDPLVGLGAPAPDGPTLGGDDLVAAWRALHSWARAGAAERTERLAEAEQAQTRAYTDRDRARQGIADDLRAHQVPFPADQPRDAPLAAVASAAASTELERARGVHARITERRAEVVRLGADRAAAEQAHQVARMLAGLLRSDRFPRWLVASALDALVVDASRVLVELSGGQFELTHSDGEFLVVDHADADSRRPVKTLSGGETFQASLALALALSEQLATLASAGAARLDSIFLDEGFGSLDEANLEIVAGTLENLAALGDRMVGVITHVPALAERVPVRFTVARDQRTASISRDEAAG